MLQRQDRLCEFVYEGPTSGEQRRAVARILGIAALSLIAAIAVRAITGSIAATVVLVVVGMLGPQINLIVIGIRHWRRIHAPNLVLAAPDGGLTRESARLPSPFIGVFEQKDIGRVYVIRSTVEALCVEPVCDRTEPIRLCENDPAFRALQFALTSQGDDGTDAATLSWRRVFARMRSVGLLSVGTLWLPQVAIFGGILSKQSDWVTTVLYPVLFGVITLSSAMLLVLNVRTPHLLVPGGLVIRRTNWLSTRSSYRLWTPSESTLFVYPNTFGEWCFALLRRYGGAGGTITKAEAEMLLRFWLSDFEPPSQASLASLLGA